MIDPNHYNGETTFISDREQTIYDKIVAKEHLGTIATRAWAYNKFDIFIGTKRRAVTTMVAGAALAAAVTGGVALEHQAPHKGTTQWPVPNVGASAPYSQGGTEAVSPNTPNQDTAVAPSAGSLPGATETPSPAPSEQPGNITNHRPEIMQHPVVVIPAPIPS